MKNCFKLYLIRHGESANNALPENQRVADPSLTELGFRQADKLGLRFRDHVADGNPVDLILTSPFLRTLQTINPTAKHLSMRPQIRSGLYEAGGCFEGYRPNELVGQPGMTDTEIARQFPAMQIPAEIDANGWYKSKPFETWEQAKKRAALQAQLLKDEFTGREISVLCTVHADLIGLLLGELCPQQPDLATTMVSNTSVTALSFSADNPDNPSALFFNDAGHLEPHEISH